ncbi:MAG: ABC transporter permease [Candidatus Hodarchaeales archaeon]
MLLFDEYSELDTEAIILRTVLSVVLLVMLITFSYWQRIKMSHMFVVSYLRGLVQLLLMGLILIIIFSLENLVILFLVLIFMSFFAAFSMKRRYNYPNIFQIQLLAITAGSFSIVILVVGLGIIEPIGEFIIPIGSMVIGNTMIIVTIAMERMYSDFRKSKGLIETALALGDSPRNASKQILNDAMRAGLMPSTNRLAILGIVNIPGLMAGMIIGGINPIEAATYQIIIFLMILTAGFIAEIVVGEMFIKEFFNEDYQLNDFIFMDFKENDSEIIK